LEKSLPDIFLKCLKNLAQYTFQQHWQTVYNALTIEIIMFLDYGE